MLRGMVRLFPGSSMEMLKTIGFKLKTVDAISVHCIFLSPVAWRPNPWECSPTKITSPAFSVLPYIINLQNTPDAHMSPSEGKVYPITILSYLCLSFLISHHSQWSFQDPATQAMAQALVCLFLFVSNPIQNDTWTHCECLTQLTAHDTYHTGSAAPREIWTSSVKQFTTNTLGYSKNVK